MTQNLSAAFPPPARTEDAPGAPVCVAFDDAGLANELFGPHNANLDILARCSGLAIGTRGTSVTIRGEARKSALAQNLLAQLYGLLKTGTRLHPRDVAHAYESLALQPDMDLKTLFQEVANGLQQEGRIQEAKAFGQASVHWLRHTRGSHLGNAGVPPNLIQKLLGHASLATTSIYMESDEERLWQELVAQEASHAD